MKSNVPWSVKGIDPEARVVAKEAARKAGMTLGEWMTHMIHELGAEDQNPATDSDALDQTPLTKTAISSDQLRAVVDSLNRLNERLKAAEENLKRNEEKSIEAAGGLNQGLETIFERLKRVEKERKMSEAAGGASPELVSRLERLEQNGEDRERIQSLKALEQALTQMVSQFDSTRNEALVRIAENEKAVDALQDRVENIDVKTAAQFQEVQDAFSAINTQLDHTERTAKSVMAEAQSAAGSSDQEFVERTSKKLQLLGNEIKRSGDQIAAVETMVSSLSEKIEAAEHRSAEGIAEVAAEINDLRQEFAPALSRAVSDHPAEVGEAAAEAEETVASLQRSYNEMVARLDDSDEDALGDDTDTAMPLGAAQEVPYPAPSSEKTDDDFDDLDLVPSDEQSDAEFDAVFDAPGANEGVEDAAKPLTPREKILAAAKARRKRLADEQAALPQDEENATESEAEEKDRHSVLGDRSDEAEHADIDAAIKPDGQNRKLGLPLIALLGLLILAMLAAGLIFFGGGSKEEEAVEETAMVDEGIPAEEVVPAPAPLPPVAAPDGKALYEQGKAMLNNAISLEDQAAAFTVVREAALYGHVPAQYLLGEMFFNGLGTDQNFINAKRWYNDAALSGNALAMHRLGTLAIEESDFSLSLEWFERAANYGVIDSMYNLGLLYDPNAEFLPPDMHNVEQSYLWYELAAQKGDMEARKDADIIRDSLT
ncbi:MAG: hypothetical protein AAF603_09300, partial [Pseudomonadota bacterium]